MEEKWIWLYCHTVILHLIQMLSLVVVSHTVIVKFLKLLESFLLWSTLVQLLTTTSVRYLLQRCLHPGQEKAYQRISGEWTVVRVSFPYSLTLSLTVLSDCLTVGCHSDQSRERGGNKGDKEGDGGGQPLIVLLHTVC